MKNNEMILFPSDTRLTVSVILKEKQMGINIQLSNYIVKDVYWEEVYYPYPHSSQRILLKKKSGNITYNKYMETVIEILKAIN